MLTLTSRLITMVKLGATNPFTTRSVEIIPEAGRLTSAVDVSTLWRSWGPYFGIAHLSPYCYYLNRTVLGTLMI